MAPAEALPVEVLVDPVVPTVVSEDPSSVVSIISPEITEVPIMESELSTADDVLGALIAASVGVETGSYEMNVTSNVEVDGLGVPVSMRIFGDYQKPDRQQVTVEAGVSFFKIQIEMVIVGDLVYVKDPIMGELGS